MGPSCHGLGQTHDQGVLLRDLDHDCAVLLLIERDKRIEPSVTAHHVVIGTAHSVAERIAELKQRSGISARYPRSSFLEGPVHYFGSSAGSEVKNTDHRGDDPRSQNLSALQPSRNAADDAQHRRMSPMRWRQRARD